ncbi:MAG: response regulator transcription factor [Alphaproteobacteria bacterium]|nr:response regulator transcription factor [Alphaproteobacteria bacterium]
MRVVVLEDERPALEQLLAAVHACRPDVEVVAAIDSVADAVAWLRSHPEPDLVLADVRLTDGRSLSVFEAVEVRCPVVFVTAYDQYTMAGLEAGGIDYLLKPVDPARLAVALEKVARLRAHFTGREPRSPRQRVLVRRSGEMHAVPVEDIAWFTTEHRLVLLVTRQGQRFVVDRTLADLATELDPERFFRINRSWLVSVDAIRGFRSAGKGRLSLSLAPETDRDAVVSAEFVGAFRAWLDR